ncbi:MAG: type I-E CRISPR-associated protein Cse1/CasA, partial [Candidatus Competibacteraceae bacterium]|nr:type I-E CRISPR-associated protein Cse1/CasA [Candidatus Competibacteraceae bacterium]
MNLLEEPWIPVRANLGSGPFRLLTLEELLCHDGDWRISLPRDDLELACIQLLVCMVQVMLLPENDTALLERLRQPLSSEALANGMEPCKSWYDFDHPTQPFMQTLGVKAAESTPIQKLFIGLPEGNNHAFFNGVGEVTQVGATIAAIALFNQASNCPSFGGGFKGSLRGGAPVTTLVMGSNLRETVWRNVLTLSRIRERLPGYQWDLSQDVPTWIKPIPEKATIQASEIGLARGLFWQPAHIELVREDADVPCDV